MAKAKIGTYDWAVGLIRSYLSIFGLWIYPNCTLLRRTCSYIPICALNCYLCICVLIPEMWALYKIRKDMELVIGNLMVSLTFYLTIFKSFFLLFKREAFMAVTVTNRSENKGEILLKLVVFVCYTSYLMFLTFLYCWASETLSDKSKYIYKAVYNSNWTVLPANDATLINMICLGSYENLQVTAGKFLPITLNTYAKGQIDPLSVPTLAWTLTNTPSQPEKKLSSETAKQSHEPDVLS
nr:PREDICTED: uncharacterized protein LOC105272397 [Fopius arisanus]